MYNSGRRAGESKEKESNTTLNGFFSFPTMWSWDSKSRSPVLSQATSQAFPGRFSEVNQKVIQQNLKLCTRKHQSGLPEPAGDQTIYSSNICSQGWDLIISVCRPWRKMQLWGAGGLVPSAVHQCVYQCVTNTHTNLATVHFSDLSCGQCIWLT